MTVILHINQLFSLPMMHVRTDDLATTTTTTSWGED